MLTYDEQKEAVNLAMQIETGTVDYLEVCKKFAKDKQKALDIVAFWFAFNAMTQNALNLLCYFKKRYDLGKCFNLEAYDSGK